MFGLHFVTYNLKGRYREIFQNFLHILVDIAPQITSLNVYFPKPFIQEIWAVLKAYFKTLPVWAGLY